MQDNLVCIHQYQYLASLIVYVNALSIRKKRIQSDFFLQWSVQPGRQCGEKGTLSENMIGRWIFLSARRHSFRLGFWLQDSKRLVHSEGMRILCRKLSSASETGGSCAISWDLDPSQSSVRTLILDYLTWSAVASASPVPP